MAQQSTWTPEPDVLSASGHDPGAHTEPPWDHAHLAGDPRWQLAQRIAGSASFGKSALLSKFLLYVCDRSLSGKTEEISEYQIGIHVFGSRPGYSPGEDNVVRNYARQLRQRLDNYFEEEGKFEALRLSIPRGKYVPLFLPHQAIDPEIPSFEDNLRNTFRTRTFPLRLRETSPNYRRQLRLKAGRTSGLSFMAS